MRTLPGTALLDIARAWFDEGTVARVFEPLVADAAHEAMTTRGWQRHRATLQQAGAFVMTFLTLLPRALACRQVAAEAVRTLALLVCITVLGGFAMAAVFVEAVWWSWMLAPSIATVSWVLAIGPLAVVAAARSRAQRLSILSIGVATSVVLLPVTGWIVPAANQAWRAEVVEEGRGALPPRRGARELSVPELFGAVPPMDALPGVNRQLLALERSNRASVVVMPLTLLLVGLSLGGGRRRPHAAALVLWLLAGATWLVPEAPSSSAWWPWLPHALAWSVVVSLGRPRPALG